MKIGLFSIFEPREHYYSISQGEGESVVPIDLSKWLELIDTRGDLSPVETMERYNPKFGRYEKVKISNAAVRRYPIKRLLGGKKMMYLIFQDGDVECRCPVSEEKILLEIALELDAELYRIDFGRYSKIV